GVMNLGIEGVMLLGAMVAVAVQVTTGSAAIACLAAAAAGASLSAVHAGLVVFLRVDQIVSGLALTMLGTGLAGYLGRPFVGVQIPAMPTVGSPAFLPAAADWSPIFKQDLLAYLVPVAA